MKKLEVNQKDLKNNIDFIKRLAKQKGRDDNGNKLKLIAVVKANGMGLGLEEYSKFLIKNGITSLAVANFEEAIKLRELGIKEEIIMLSPTPIKKELQMLIDKNIILTIGGLNDLKIIEDLVEKNEKITEVQAHLKIDVGFGRYGILYDNYEEIFKVFSECKKIKIIGTYTHFSKPNNKKLTEKQFHRFLDIIARLKEAKYNPGMLHCCASTSFLRYPEMYLNAVRIGSVIQGRTLDKISSLKKVGVFKTNITQIKLLPKGYTISYNNTYKLKRNTKVAIIPVGYMDGLNRNKLRDDFSLKNNIISVGMEIKKIFKDNNLKVTINDKKYKIIGKLGMYHSIIDITDSNDIEVGDTVILDITPLQANDDIRREYI